MNIFNDVMVIFFILALGYILGRIPFLGIKLGTSGVLLVAIVMGHFGYEVAGIVGQIGLVLFLSCVGLVAGPMFVKNLKSNILAFILTSISVVISAGVLIAIVVKFFDISLPLALGLSAGALTSTASLAATIEATGSSIASVGYGITYIFGVVGVILFVQILPKIMKVNIDDENAKLVSKDEDKSSASLVKYLINIDASGIFVISLAVVIGVLIGSISIPLGPNIKFSLGNSGGSLIAGLILGHFGHIGKISLKAPKTTLNPIRDLGISLFLIQNGAKAGTGFVEVLADQGIKLFVIGIIMTLVAVSFAFIISRYLFKMPLFAALGATTGAMTSAPSLSALIAATNNNDNVTAFYAACQPIATIALVLLPQIMVSILGN
ncbi:antiporter [Peptoniphilus stercorisuis]|uniref:Transport protein n=1 Tax=Peptoniphilus stercorisuis TaxID=1436965 RepID=A0ABS4KF44_9FIRM|nr:antiporter [Peptoniphilus stercorisuis]MBP2025264.1 putative transport protein [Peptoniphilus stercorisuis]